jgi:hypothetical protein
VELADRKSLKSRLNRTDTFEMAKWRVFCHSAGLQISPARFKQV